MIAKVLAGQRGAGTLPETLAGVVLHLIGASMAVAAIVAALSTYTFVQARASIAEQAISAESAIRSDIRWASAITADGPDRFTATVPDREDACLESTWEIRDGALVNETITYAATDTTATPVTCAGEPSARASQRVINRLGPDASFTYLNIGGRQVLGTDAEGNTLLAESANPGVPVPSFEAHAITGVQADLTAGAAVKRMSVHVLVRQTSQNMDTHDAPTLPQVFLDHVRLSPDADVPL